ncbi:MFS transporter [Saccharopolyspora sp. NPDC003752]
MRHPLAGLIAATTISSVGTGMTMLAIPWFVLESTGRGVDTGLVVMAEVVGLLLGSAFGGPWIDRLHPRRAAVLFDLAAAVVVLGIPLLHHYDALPLWLLGALGLLLGLSRAPGDAARQVLIPDIALRAGIAVERVSGAYDAPNQGARALGAPIAGAIIAMLGAPAALVVDAASFVLAATITRLTLDEAAIDTAGGGGGYLRQLGEGFRFLRNDRTLFAILCMVAVTNGLNSGFFSVLVPVYGQVVLHSSLGVGLISGASGAAMVLSTVLFAWIGLRWRRWPVLVVCYLLVLGPRPGIFLLQPDLVVLVAVSGVIMLAFGPLNPIIGAVKAERTPPQYRARVFGAISAAALLGMPAGTLAAGFLSDHIGLMPSIAVFTAASAAMSLCPLLFSAWRAVDERTSPARERAEEVL